MELKLHNKDQFTKAEGQDVKTIVVPGYIIVAVPHTENNSCQSHSSYHQHEPIVTDNYVETIAKFGEMLCIQ